MKDALNQVGEGQNVDQGREVRESFKDGLQNVDSGSLTFFSVPKIGGDAILVQSRWLNTSL